MRNQIRQTEAKMTFKCMFLLVLVITGQAVAGQSNQGGSTTSACSTVADSCDSMIMKLVHTLFDEKGNVCDCQCPEATPVDCSEIKQRDPKATSGIYYIKPRGYHSQFRVYCNMLTDGGGWTVFQRRMDGSIEFNTTWQNYKMGFGTLMGEHWLGNEFLHYLTRQGLYTLHIDMEDWQDAKTYAKYSKFNIDGESDNYRVDFGRYLSGTVPDRFTEHKDQPFSTFDRDNDSASRNNCAANHSGGWWFRSCDKCNLNGKYYKSHTYNAIRDIGIEWKPGSYSTNTFYSLKYTEMKVRPITY